MKKYLLLFIVIGFILVSEAHAAITFDNATSSSVVSGTSSTFAYTTSGNNRLLIVGIRAGLTQGTNNITGVTYAGTPMTLDGSVFTPSDRWTYMFSLINPTIGTNNVVVSTTGGNTFIGLVYSSYTGVAALNTTSTATSTAATSFTTSVTTTILNDWAALFSADTLGSSVTATSTPTGVTSRAVNSFGGQVFDSNTPINPTTTYTVRLAGGSQTWGTVMASFAPTIASTSDALFFAGD